MPRWLHAVLYRRRYPSLIRSRPRDPESFVPVHPLELEDWLRALHADSTVGFQHWHAAKETLAEAIHQSVRTEFRSLLSDYARVDPDAEEPRPPMAVHQGPHGTQRETAKPRLAEIIDRLDALLAGANYRRLTPLDISDALRTASTWGIELRVRFRDFHRLRVYARGDALEARSQRTWYLLFAKRSMSVSVYRQMVVVYQPRVREANAAETRKLSLRMFKNVPHADIDMLLPGSVRMSLLDQGRIGIPTLWGFAMLVSKLARNLWLLALFGAMKILTSVTFFAAVVIASVVYACKLFFSYRHAKNRHLLNVAQNLYYQTLSNNAGVILRLMDEAEQQLACQTLLVLYELERNQGHEPMSIESLDAACEAILTSLGLGRLDFDIERSLGFLAKHQFAECTDEGWRLRMP